MGRMTATAVIGLVLAVAVSSCGDITEPVPNIEVRVAHAAPGLGTATVHLNSVPEFTLPAAASGFFVLQQQPVRYDFVIGADTAGVDVSHEADINAVILMDRANPTLHYVQLDRAVNEVRILLINADFATTDPMTIRVEAADTTFEETVAPGAQALVEPDPGSFGLLVRPGGTDTFVELESFSLVLQDHGFLVIAPLAEAAEGTGYTRILF